MSSKKTPASKASAKPKRSVNKPTVTARLLLSIAPFAIFAAALFLETCLILGESAGNVGSFVQKILFGLLGYASHILCVSALALSFFFKELTQSRTLRFKLITGSALCVISAAFTSLVMQNGMRDAVLSLPTFFNDGANAVGGGAFGGFFGLILSKLLTPAVATAVCAAAAVALLSFTVGTTRLGAWRVFSKHRQVTKPAPAAPEKAAKKSTPPTVAPRKISTVVSTDTAPLPYTAELPAGVGAGYLPEQYSADDNGDEDFTDADFDEINASGGIGTVDFNAPEPVTPVFKPTDLMDELGLRASTAKPKTDIYDEGIKSPAADNSGARVWSPFNTLKSKDEVFNAKNTPKAAAKPAPQSVAYNPLTDPLRSIKDREEAKANAAKNDYEVWKETHGDVSPITPPAPPADDSAATAPLFTPIAPATPISPISTPSFTPSPAFSPITAAADEDDYEDAVVASDYDDGDGDEDEDGYTAPTETVVTEDDDDLPAEAVFTPTAFEPSNTEPPTPPSSFSFPKAATPAPTTAPKSEVYTEEEENPAAINPYSKYTKLRYPRYHAPSTDLLDAIDTSSGISEDEIYEIQSKLHTVFENFNVNASVTGYSVGPSITRYEISPGPGVKAKQITGLGEDIALALQSENRKGDIRIVTVQGKSVMGVEVPNSKTKKVSLRALIENKDFKNAKSKITVCVGLTVSGKPIYMNIDDMPHVLVAGQTKSGKSVAINCMIMSLIYRASPDEVQLILIDPKRVELSIYNDIPHMIMPVIDDPKRAAAALKWAVAEMERRYDLLNKARVRNRDEYYQYRDQNPDFEYMPQIVIIIDELADLMLQVREHVEGLINRLAAMARACGMHIVIGTQRPSVDVVTGLIKANIPSHIAFKVSSHTDSRVILGNIGAEKLLGRGDMLYHPTGSNQIRAQGAFVDTPEIKRVLNYIIEKNGSAEYNPEILYVLQEETDKLNKVEKKSAMSDDDYAVDGYDPDFDLLCQATELVLNLGKATTNIVQRHLRIGFNRAANIIDKLEEIGFVSPLQGSKPREVLIDWKTYEQWKSNNKK